MKFNNDRTLESKIFEKQNKTNILLFQLEFSMTEPIGRNDGEELKLKRIEFDRSIRINVRNPFRRDLISIGDEFLQENWLNRPIIPKKQRNDKLFFFEKSH